MDIAIITRSTNMKSFNKISDLSGLAILTFKGGDSPLCVGEVANHQPFQALKGFERGMGIPVSDKKLAGIVKRQEAFSKTKRMTHYSKLKIYSVREEQQFHSTTVTLLKNVTNDTFQTKLTPQVVEFITGKKSVWKNKGYELPKLTTEQLVICTMAEFALDKFHTLNGLELKCSFYNGGEIVWNSRY